MEAAHEKISAIVALKVKWMAMVRHDLDGFERQYCGSFSTPERESDLAAIQQSFGELLWQHQMDALEVIGQCGKPSDAREHGTHYPINGRA